MKHPAMSDKFNESGHYEQIKDHKYNKETQKEIDSVTREYGPMLEKTRAEVIDAILWDDQKREEYEKITNPERAYNAIWNFIDRLPVSKMAPKKSKTEWNKAHESDLYKNITIKVDGVSTKIDIARWENGGQNVILYVIEGGVKKSIWIWAGEDGEYKVKINGKLIPNPSSDLLYRKYTSSFTQ